MATKFQKDCWELLKLIPKGRVTTYAAIARALNSKAYRAVGQAMNKNPHPVLVPCHRVVASTGDLHGYAYGLKKKQDLLESEGVVIKEGRIDLTRFGFEYPRNAISAVDSRVNNSEDSPISIDS